MSGRKVGPPELRVLGWREWVELPELGVRAIKAKLDTGAQTSSLHAFKLRHFTRDGIAMVRFEVHPVQRSKASTVTAEAEVRGRRTVRASNGQEEERFVIVTQVAVGGERWPIELTLARRDEMGFRMLLGRRALAGRAFVDPGAGYLADKGVGVPGANRRDARVSRRSNEEEE